MLTYRQPLPALVLTAGLLAGACLIHNMLPNRHIQERTLSMSAVVEKEPLRSDDDSRFLDNVSDYDKSVVTNAQGSLGRLKHPELRKLAQHIILVQQAEAKQLQDWRQKWYGP